ncbi:ATP-binding protein [Paenibacillus alkaliterrae]|uniref:ExeA family protein n=1 Tax=Paenibacillus alkaliterrae TaxID=320909 RepID=UPI001F411AE8|nr:ATP-binding protein [Paenibacillus alkaliterrae]MCF2941737.1 ATP-binding protein [Paenibacillus alkaliterrae]
MLSFFGLKDMPFTREIDAKNCYASNAYQEALARLEFAVQHRHACMVTGEAGTGKTTAVRSLLRGLETTRYRYEYICDSGLSPKLFYREVLDRFGVSPAIRSTEAKRQYQALMLNLYEQDKKIPIIVLDEAHRFSEGMLQELRFLLNYPQLLVIRKFWRYPVRIRVLDQKLTDNVLVQITSSRTTLESCLHYLAT